MRNLKMRDGLTRQYLYNSGPFPFFMTEYLIYKLERFRSEGGEHTCNQVKYLCEITAPKQSVMLRDRIIEMQTHPYTDDNPHRLFGKIASIYKIGDTVKTIPEAEISDAFDGKDVELKEPLSHDELRILSVQVLDALGRK